MPSRTPQGEEATTPQGGASEQVAKDEAVSERMRELGKKSAEARKARREAERLDLARQQDREQALAASSDQTALVTVPIPIAAILRELRRKATSGDVAASRELRAWLQEHPPADADELLHGLDRAKRALLARWLQAQEDESAGQSMLREGTNDGFDSLPIPTATPGASPQDDEPLPLDGAGGDSRPLETPQPLVQNA